MNKNDDYKSYVENNNYSQCEIEECALEKVKVAKNKEKWNKRIVVVVEIFLTVITGLMFAFGIYVKSEFIQGFFSGCFTALIVTLIDMVVRWNTETDVERTIKMVEKDTSKRIESIQNITTEMADELNDDIHSLRGGLEELNNSINSFSNVIDIYNGKACTFCKNYIKDVKFNRKDCRLEDFFATANDSVSILATNLKSFVPHLPQLVQLTERGVNVRVATIHPNYARDFNISRITGTTGPEKRWADMRDSLRTFLAFSSQDDVSHDRFQVRAYSGIAPTLILIMVDNACYVAYLINGMQARDTIHFLFSEGDVITESSPIYYFKKHFESIWADDQTKECTVDEISSIKYDES